MNLPLPRTISEPLGRARRRAEALRRDLEDASAPWRTSSQLERLAHKPAASDGAVRFAVLGDAEPGRFWIWRRLFNVPGVFERQLKDVQRRRLDFTMQLGDMVSRGTDRNFLAFFRDLARWGVSKPYLTVIGNHDRRFPHGVSDSRLYRSLLGRTNYCFDRGPARFVVLDSSTQRLRSRQLDWLARVLDTRLRKAVFMHMPPASLREWTDFGGLRGIGGFRRGADRLLDILSERRTDRVYLGHIHGFGVQDLRGVRFVLTGGGGSPLFPSGVRDRFHHYLVVRVSPDGFRETVRFLDGRMLRIPNRPVILSR